MNVTELKEEIIARLELLSDEEIINVYPKIVGIFQSYYKTKIELDKHAPGILERYEDLMKKLA